MYIIIIKQILSTIFSIRNNLHKVDNKSSTWRYDIEYRLKEGTQSKLKLEYKITELLTKLDQYFIILKESAKELEYVIDQPDPSVYYILYNQPIIQIIKTFNQMERSKYN